MKASSKKQAKPKATPKPKKSELDNYPIPAFRFNLSFEEKNSSDAGKKGEMSFQEISGISVEIPVEEVQEGGENRFTHRLPQPLKYPNLVLKRGVSKNSSDLVKWCRESTDVGYANAIKPKNVVVTLLDDQNKAVISWSFTNAYPVKWEYSSLDAGKNDILIQTFELCYQYFTELVA